MLAQNVADSATIAEYTDTVGTGPIALRGALAGCFRFRDGHPDGDSTIEYIVSDGPNTEVVLGTLTYGDPDSLSLDTIETSSNGGAAISWSGNTRPLVHEAAAGTGKCVPADIIDVYSGTSI